MLSAVGIGPPQKLEGPIFPTPLLSTHSATQAGIRLEQGPRLLYHSGVTAGCGKDGAGLQHGAWPREGAVDCGLCKAAVGGLGFGTAARLTLPRAQGAPFLQTPQDAGQEGRRLGAWSTEWVWSARGRERLGAGPNRRYAPPIGRARERGLAPL